MQVHIYDVVEVLQRKKNLYLARAIHIAEEHIVVLKTNENKRNEASSRQDFLAECTLLNGLDLANFRLMDVGRDEELGLDYYAALVPGQFKIMSFESLDPEERVRMLIDVAKAIRKLNKQGVAYRNFASPAFGRLNNEVLLYDFARATQFGPDRLRSPSAQLESFDPPEARLGVYDVVKGEAFGLGHLIRNAALKSETSARLADRLMTSPPDKRPTVEVVIEELGLLM